MTSENLTGLTMTECASACNADRCAITGLGRCCHPCTSGLPIERLNDPIVMAGFTDACAAIGVENTYLGRTRS